MNTRRSLIPIIISALFTSSCGIKLIFPTPMPELSAPPVEGEGSAPPLDASAEEILIESMTPAGVCSVKKEIEKLDCYNFDGDLISSIQVPGIASTNPQGLHLAGSASSGTAMPVAYSSWSPEQSLIKSENGTVLNLRRTNSFYAMVGVPEEPILVFSDVVFENSIPNSYLYSDALINLGSSEPFFEMKDPKMQMVLMPVAVEAEGSRAGKVWFTHSAWEFSGEERIFPTNSGLFIFDIKNGQNIQALGAERSFQGLSPDRSLAGSTSIDLKGDHSMQVIDLLTGRKIEFPLDPASDRGAGYTVFSIDSKYAAWVESSGSLVAGPSEFKTRIRIGNIETGAVIQELDSSSALKALNWEWISFMRPVGWLDSQTLIVEVHAGDPKIAALIKFDVFNGNIKLLAEGSFAGFSYP